MKPRAMSRRPIIAPFALFFLCLAASWPSGAFASQKLFWGEKVPAALKSADSDGSNVQTLHAGGPVGSVASLAVSESNRVYWVEDNTMIRRIDHDGKGIQTLASGLNVARAVAVDEAGGHLYWSVVGKIVRADLNGSNPQDFVTGLTTPFEIELDVAQGKIYWCDVHADLIQRAELVDGSNVVTIIDATQADGPSGLDLDLAGGKLYWANQSGMDRSIRRANLNGTSDETIVPVADPQGVAVDAANGHVYWTDQATEKIQRSDLEGNNVVDINIVPSLSLPSGIETRLLVNLPSASDALAYALAGLLGMVGAFVLIRRRLGSV